MEEEKKTEWTDEKIIESNEKWFKFFVYVPKISTAIFALLFFVIGINMGSGGETLGVFAIGAIVCVVVYAAAKLSLAYKILHIYYLKELTKKVGLQKEPKDENETVETQEEK